MSPQLATEIATLQGLNTRTLKARYRELFREESRSSNHQYLVRRIAWRLQAIAIGELSERARVRAAELARDEDLRLRPTRDICRQISEGQQMVPSAGDPRIPAVGQTLERQYRGSTVQVRILDAGFEWNGRVYGSLSAVAWHATGTRWNGYTFFGLNGKVDHV